MQGNKCSMIGRKSIAIEVLIKLQNRNREQEIREGFIFYYYPHRETIFHYKSIFSSIARKY